MNAEVVDFLTRYVKTWEGAHNACTAFPAAARGCLVCEAERLLARLSAAAPGPEARDAARTIVERHGTSDCSCLRDEFPCEKCHMAIEDIVAALSRPAPEDDAGRPKEEMGRAMTVLMEAEAGIVETLDAWTGQPPTHPIHRTFTRCRRCGGRGTVIRDVKHAETCWFKNVAGQIERLRAIVDQATPGPEGSATPPLLAAPSGTASVAPSLPFMLPDPAPTTPDAPDGETR